MKKIRILNLYPDEMNIYGDSGNVLALTRRLQWHGYDSEVIFFHPGDIFPNDVDLVIGGGGQDSGQKKISNDLIRIAPNLQGLADSGVPMLMICGLFQLFGHRFVTENGTEIKGIGIFDAETIAKDKRLIGNIVIETECAMLNFLKKSSMINYFDAQQTERNIAVLFMLARARLYVGDKIPYKISLKISAVKKKFFNNKSLFGQCQY